ncbi:O-antigen ligase family protein [Alcanivorax sp. MM125-6]|nr:O-antigen ligase family protein [Alcanivorax sp. MM125-6]
MTRKEKLLLVWMTVSFCLFFGGLLMFDRRPRLLNVLDVLFFAPAFVYAVRVHLSDVRGFLKQNLWLLVFLVFATASTFFAEQPNVTRFTRAFFQIFTLFAFTQAILRTHAALFWRALLGGILFGALVAMVDFYCYYFVVGRPFSDQLYGNFEVFHINRFITLSTNQLHASMYFVTLPFFAFLAASRLPQSLMVRLAPYAATLMIVVYLIANQRRSTLVALVAGCLILPLVTLKKKLIVPLLLVGVIIGSIFVIKPDIIVERGASNRFAIWTETWHSIQERPLLGHGMAGEMPDIHIIRPDNGKPDVYSHPHNYYLSVLYYLGFFGLALWTMVWLPSALRGLRPNYQAQLALAALATGLTAVLFDGVHPYTPFMYNWPSVWIPMALLAACTQRYQRNE